MVVTLYSENEVRFDSPGILGGVADSNFLVLAGALLPDHARAHGLASSSHLEPSVSHTSSAENIAHLCTRTKSKTWGKDCWKSASCTVSRPSLV